MSSLKFSETSSNPYITFDTIQYTKVDDYPDKQRVVINTTSGMECIHNKKDSYNYGSNKISKTCRKNNSKSGTTNAKI